MHHAQPDAVRVAVFPGERHGILVEVDASDLASPAAQEGIEPEAAGVAAKIEHRTIGAKPGQVAAVVALVAEEARLVAFLEMNPVANPMLVDGHAGWKLGTGDGTARKVFLLGDSLVDLHPEVPRRQVMRAPLQDRPDALIHSQAEDLDRQDVVVTIGDQTREPVALGMQHAIRVGLLVEPEDVARSATASAIRRSQNSGPGGSDSLDSSLRLISDRGFQSPYPSARPSRSTIFTRSPWFGCSGPIGPITIFRKMKGWLPARERRPWARRFRESGFGREPSAVPAGGNGIESNVASVKLFNVVLIERAAVGIEPLIAQETP